MSTPRKSLYSVANFDAIFDDLAEWFTPLLMAAQQSTDTNKEVKVTKAEIIEMLNTKGRVPIGVLKANKVKTRKVSTRTTDSTTTSTTSTESDIAEEQSEEPEESEEEPEEQSDPFAQIRREEREALRHVDDLDKESESESDDEPTESDLEFIVDDSCDEDSEEEYEDESDSGTSDSGTSDSESDSGTSDNGTSDNDANDENIVG